MKLQSRRPVGQSDAPDLDQRVGSIAADKLGGKIGIWLEGNSSGFRSGKPDCFDRLPDFPADVDIAACQPILNREIAAKKGFARNSKETPLRELKLVLGVFSDGKKD